MLSLRDGNFIKEKSLDGKMKEALVGLGALCAGVAGCATMAVDYTHLLKRGADSAVVQIVDSVLSCNPSHSDPIWQQYGGLPEGRVFGYDFGDITWGEFSDERGDIRAVFVDSLHGPQEEIDPRDSLIIIADVKYGTRMDPQSKQIVFIDEGLDGRDVVEKTVRTKARYGQHTPTGKIYTSRHPRVDEDFRRIAAQVAYRLNIAKTKCLRRPQRGFRR